MYKAVDLRTGQDIVILHPAWAEQIEVLRTLDRAGVIVCQGCQQPVRVRAGVLRRRHFAHKQLLDCPFGRESPALLLARAALYQRLLQVFGEKVTVEKQFDSDLFPRPVDCWVEREQGSFAYWVADTRLQPLLRSRLANGFLQAKARPNWIFTSDLLHESGRTVGSDLPQVLLSTTERDLMQSTYFDLEVGDTVTTRGGSLHYLDAEQETLTTYRSLHLTHAPQLHVGRRYKSPLSEVLFAFKTGDPAHPGERERTREVIAEKERLEELDRKREEEARLRREAAVQAADRVQAALRQNALSQPGHVRAYAVTVNLQQADRTRRVEARNETPEEEPAAYPERAGTCIFCGVITNRWVSFNGASNTCKCRDCYQLGRY